MPACSWGRAAIRRPRCCYSCAAGTASGRCASTRRAMRKRWRRCSRRTASGFTSRATGTAKRRSTACTWKSWWRRRRWSEGGGAREAFDSPQRRRDAEESAEKTKRNWEGARSAPSLGLRGARTGPVRRPGQEACPTLPAGLFLGRGQVADDEVFLYLVDHELVRLPRLGGVELDRLVDVLIPFFGQLVVGHDFDGVPVLLRVDAL